MGDGSVASWGLDKPHDARAQGLVVSAFPDLDAGVALLLELPRRCGGRWLAELQTVALVTSAEKPPGGGSHAPSVALAFTGAGLQAMGLDGECLKTFSTPFVEGMRQVDRQRRLGDDSEQAAMVPEGVIWSGNATDPYALDGAAATLTPVTVHAALLLYHSTSALLDPLVDDVMAKLDSFNVRIVRRVEMKLRDKDRNIREHFGFEDGISQPVPYGAGILVDGKQAKTPDPRHAVAAGDILMGHQDANLEPAPGPFVSEKLTGAISLEKGHAPNGHRDLGLDGAYLVIRELRQDVGAFWKSMEAAAKALTPPRDGKWLAERVIGRTKEGATLRPHGDLPKEKNAFGYIEDDPGGLGCPLGSHIRRANPRDGLAPSKSEGAVFLQIANRHRILRRGRKFGPPYKEDAPEEMRGLLFMGINTDIARQFEFIQQTWMLNPSFAALVGEVDPLVGRGGRFTVPAHPLRARANVETFVQLAGGDYFFLPSLPALRFLETLP
jgi:Dyp-type peroxidase family